MRSVTPSRSRADDWIRTSINRFTKPVPSYSATSAKHECKDSNPVRQFWRLTALPGAHSYRGYPTGVEPVLPASQAGVRTTYTTDTISSSSTRIRTWNLSLEARHDVRFTIEPWQSINSQRKAWDSNPHAAPSGSALAVRPGKPYPATFRMIQWTHWESNPTAFPETGPACRAGVVPLDHEP